MNYRYREGDRVSLLGIVKHPPKESWERIFIDIVCCDGSIETIWMKPQDITLVQADFRPGDFCTWEGFGDDHYATVLAISDGHAWIDMGGGAYCTRLLTAIERVSVNES